MKRKNAKAKAGYDFNAIICVAQLADCLVYERKGRERVFKADVMTVAKKQ